MFSQDDDGEQRVALFVVFGLIALVVGLVLAVGVSRGSAFMKSGRAAAPVALATQPASPAPTPVAPAVAQAASDAASVKVEQGVVKFYFASGKADLAAGASQAMADLVKGAQAGGKLVISGFHDATGDAAKNAELARQRALAVSEALKAAGVAEGQIELRKPEQVNGSGSDAEARRVEISLQ
jgi:outer membrane protein OmpA-like peptidoglycan-associated protein